MFKVFRYVFAHSINGDVQFKHFTLEEIEIGNAFKSVEEMNNKGYELIARNYHTGTADMDGNGIYEDDLLNVNYNGLGTCQVKFKDGVFTSSSYDLSKCRIAGTIHD